MRYFSYIKPMRLQNKVDLVCVDLYIRMSIGTHGLYLFFLQLKGSLRLKWVCFANTNCTLTFFQLHYKKVDLQHRQELWHQHVLFGRLRGNIVTRHCANRPRRGRTCARTTALRRTGSQPGWTKFIFKFSSNEHKWPQIPALYFRTKYIKQVYALVS